MNYSILIVDDESMVRALLRMMLVRAGFEVTEAEDGQDALHKIAEKKPDLILLDVMMPGMDGFAVCEHLRNDPQTSALPIIMLSAKADLASINRGLQVGATEYLSKPVPRDELLEHVSNVLSYE